MGPRTSSRLGDGSRPADLNQPDPCPWSQTQHPRRHRRSRPRPPPPRERNHPCPPLPRRRRPGRPPPPGPRAARSRRSIRAVIAWIDDFEPENDADLHDFLQSLAAGLHDIGASLNDLYELCTSPGVRIGKGGMTATHEAADSIAEASAGVSAASSALAAYYAGVSEEVAEGVELPKDGDFITGEGAGT